MTKAERVEGELRDEWLCQWLVLDVNPFALAGDHLPRQMTAWAKDLEVHWYDKERGDPLLVFVKGVTADGEEVTGTQLVSGGPTIDPVYVDEPPPNKYRQMLPGCKWDTDGDGN